MPRVVVSTETTLPPQKVVELLTDFTPRRPEIWPGLWEGAYEVFSVTPTSAEVREGNKSPKVWAREHYDWSKPGVVRWEVVESNFCAPGSYVETKIDEREDGGSRLTVTWNRKPTSPMGKITAALIVLTRGAPVKASLKAGIKKAGG